MSRETPEVGDIWLDLDQRKLFLFMITPKHLHFIRRKYGSSKDKVVIVTRVRHYFTIGVKFTYVGKSKAQISDLFELSND